MTAKLKRQMDHLRLILNAEKNWDFWTKGNDGVFQGKISIMTFGRPLILTRSQLRSHIKRTKKNIKKCREFSI